MFGKDGVKKRTKDAKARKAEAAAAAAEMKVEGEKVKNEGRKAKYRNREKRGGAGFSVTFFSNRINQEDNTHPCCSSTNRPSDIE